MASTAASQTCMGMSSQTCSRDEMSASLFNPTSVMGTAEDATGQGTHSRGKTTNAGDA